MDRAATILYASQASVDSYITFASLTLLYYDWLLTLPSEVEYMWFSPWNVGKLLFFVTRYLALADTPLTLHGGISSLTVKTCTIIYNYTSWSFTIGVAVADAIIMLRTWAVWNNTKGWALGLAILYLCKWISATVVISIFLGSVVFGPSPDPGITGCYFVATSDVVGFGYALMAASEFFIFSMTAVKGVYHLRRKSPLLLSTLYRDGLMFSMILACVSVMNAVVIAGTSADKNLLLSFQRVIYSVLSSRIILHLRQASAGDSEYGKMSTGDSDSEEKAHSTVFVP